MLAIEEINAAGGVLGKQIELVYEDDQSKPGEAATVVKKLITRDQVVALLGEVASSRSLAAAPICQQNQVPMISPSSTNPKVTEVGDYIFRVCFIDPFQGTVHGELRHRDAEGQAASPILTRREGDYCGRPGAVLSRRGPSVAAAADRRASTTTAAATTTSRRSSRRSRREPEAIFVPGYYTEVGADRAARRASSGITVPLLGGDGWECAEAAGDRRRGAGGHYFSNHYAADDPIPLVQKFVDDVQGAVRPGEVPRRAWRRSATTPR